MSYKELNINKTYLITGAVGFIGYFLSRRLLDEGCRVIGIDNINDYYDVNLKYARLENLSHLIILLLSKAIYPTRIW